MTGVQTCALPIYTGYLRADPERIGFWRARLDALGPGPKIGISWRGGTAATRTAQRSLGPADLLPLLGFPVGGFVSLQYDADAAEVAALPTGGSAVHFWDDALRDYDETAALVCALDLVISVCTAVIHLTGALGRPVWVLVPSIPEWRYGVAGTEMPWYPSARLFRQPPGAAWSVVTREVADALGREFG